MTPLRETSISITTIFKIGHHILSPSAVHSDGQPSITPLLCDWPRASEGIAYSLLIDVDQGKLLLQRLQRRFVFHCHVWPSTTEKSFSLSDMSDTDSCGDSPTDDAEDPVPYPGRPLCEIYWLRDLLVSGGFDHQSLPVLPVEIANLILDYAGWYFVDSFEMDPSRELRGISDAHHILVEAPISVDCGYHVRNIRIRGKSHDQGWSSFSEDHGTRNNSWTWIEFGISPSPAISVEPRPGSSRGRYGRRPVEGGVQTRTVCDEGSGVEIEEVALRHGVDGGDDIRRCEFREMCHVNVHACNRYECFVFDVDVGRCSPDVRRGDVLRVWGRSMFPGWALYVKSCAVDVVYGVR